LVLIAGFGGVVWMAVRTYRDAPPIPDFVGPDGVVVVSRDAILAGKDVFHTKALMDYGSFFGDGANRGPDYTADALHRTAESMLAFYGGDANAAERMRRELRQNRHDPTENRVQLTEGQARAWQDYTQHIVDSFRQGGDESMVPVGYIDNEHDLTHLAAFFLWGGWICAAERPGKSYSYTHNWPYDPVAGNAPSSAVVLWSVLGTLGLMLGIGVVLYGYGRRRAVGGDERKELLTEGRLEELTIHPLQRAAYTFMVVAAGLFLAQVLAGVLTVHDFVGFTEFFGVDLADVLPITINRSWHVQLALFWIITAWVGGSIFLLPQIAPEQPRGQLALARLLSALLLVIVAGTCVGVFLGPSGMLGEWWRAFGNQGWEFVELGRFWQGLLFAALVLWSVILARGLAPAFRAQRTHSPPHWLLFALLSVMVLFLASFLAVSSTNFVIADFWRWVTIHMWVEAFFEVLTTVFVGFMLRSMGLIGVESARRAAYMAVLLFLGSGLLGIAHNFYWNAKPVAMLALGSVFSTLQVVPLVLLAVEAWRYRHLPARAEQKAVESGEVNARFGQHEAYLFLVGVSFWNFMGAGVLGFMINLPIVNYYEHGTYLTVNHGHAALMGVYGNLALAVMLFCARYLISAERWNGKLLRAAFWSINLGLALMLVLDTLPAGLLQLNTVLEEGYWAARSQAFIQGTPFQTLTWMRIVGGAIFTVGGALPIVWFLSSRWREAVSIAKVSST
jgi:nitric oxide reductase subunit B